MQQHQAFLRRARSALAADRSSAPVLARAAGMAGPGSGAMSETSSAARSRPGGARRKGGPGLVGGARLRGLPGSSTEPGMTRQGHKLLQRTAAAYGAAGASAAALAAGARGADDGERDDDTSRGSDAGGLGGGLRMAAKPGMHLSADLAGQLRYVYGLTAEDPKQQAARSAVQRFAVHDEGQRTALRRQLVERLSGARARRESALRLTADRLREQSQEHSKRVEQLRLQHLAATWQAKQRGAQMRRSLEAEAALREVFLQVLEGEKEVLLAERRAATEAAPFPRYKDALRKTEQQYLELFSTLETGIASERQQRVRAHREAQQAQRHSRQVAAAVASDRMQELLGRIARDEQVLLQRRSIATQPQSRQELVGQIRRLLGLP
ncbi:hypothetical protein TSOC_002385 [Tetrabaena socialis]|uniref:Uncharacterized protein n=1 Tax=Tetrabaena socialis TaxID=47790 RepID=A0A2J8AEF2_9CHLO|nr:hypothetical protein TSOC_002385 [Tetrabaena socialis]|eukprot:PNH10893.1 hypothetical protein TSOC_002385 [Tetrabaena socialis]